MDKNTTIAFVLIGVILVVWLYINAPEPKPVTAGAGQDTTLVHNDTSKKSQKKIAQKVVKQTPPVKEKIKDKVSTEQAGEFVSTNKPEKIITIENDKVLLEMTSKGARIKKYYLKKYKTWYHNEIKDTSDFYANHVQLINYSKNGGDFNIVFLSKSGQLINTANLDFESNLSGYRYKIGKSDSLTLAFEFKTTDNKIIRKIFTFYGDRYDSKIDVEFENMEDVISSFRYDVVWGNGINFVEKNSVDEANYAVATIYSGDENTTVNAKDEKEKTVKDMNGKIDWLALTNKYFAVILSQEKVSSDGGALIEGTFKKNVPGKGERKYYSASLKVPFNNGKIQRNTFHLFIGPLEYDLLKSYGKGFQSIIDFGSMFGLKVILRPITEYLLLPLFTFLHRFIPNYGFVIIVFSIIIKFALYPFTKQSYKSMKKMQLLQPKITELKEKHKGDQQKIQKETMKLYKTYGVNPAGGCLPMVFQMPILFALFEFFKVAIQIRQEPFIWWITNLSAPDVIATLPFKIPIFNITEVSGLAVLLGVTMFFQQKMSIKDPSQKAMVYAMPVVFTFMFMGFSSGLNLYYFLFNLFSIVQQYSINKSKKDSVLVPVKNAENKKPGFMARMMEAAEKQSQAQKKAQNKKRR